MTAPREEPGEHGEEAYRAAGVDLATAAETVATLRSLAANASRPEVVQGVGGFAGLVSLGDGRLLAASADGVGTKAEVARMSGKLDTLGVDLVAMCANDVVCTGAEPLFFLDYVAVERLVRAEVESLVAGIAEGCRRAGCALLGGETAEHPGLGAAGSFDMAGFCVGLVQEEQVLEPSRVEPGDILLGLPSSGLHSNGFSLVRRTLLEDPAALRRYVPSLGRTLGEELLEPTAIYVEPVLALARSRLARSAAHITGGGLKENLPRALPPALGAVLDSSAWRPHPVFQVVADAVGVAPLELAGVLNLGIGMVVVVPKGDEDRAIDEVGTAGTEALVVGEVAEDPHIRLR